MCALLHQLTLSQPLAKHQDEESDLTHVRGCTSGETTLLVTGNTMP